MKMNTTRRWGGKMLIALVAILPSDGARAQDDPPPASGPYYFVSDTLTTPDQFYWRGVQRFVDIDTMPNLNLLATVLDDTPVGLQFGQVLVPRERYDFRGGDAVREVELQPFAFTTRGSSHKRPLPLGANLRRFLDDPL